MIFWISWPLLWWYLRDSRRSRVLVVARGAVLLVEPWLGNGTWSLPGGGLHKGERAVDGAVRELAEETGIRIDPHQLRPLHETSYRRYGHRFMYHCFVVELPNPLAIQLPRYEINRAAWVPVADLSAVTAGPDVMASVAVWSKSAGLVN